jgi:probable addiction module antidote protein
MMRTVSGEQVILLGSSAEGLKVRDHAFDPAKYRDNPKMIAEYLNDALATEDPVLVNVAIGNMVRAQGMSKFSRKVGLRRDSLHRAFRGEVNPGFDTVLKVLLALEIQIVAQAAKARAPVRGHLKVKRK